MRSKHDREALQTTDYHQCKQFYDVVATENANNVKDFNCEHHHVTSRHQYKFVPPNTSLGFWNIGFDDSNDQR